ncbi:MAG: hypothetical protein RLY61_894 [Candidatus Parcubacteria bacterium]|jgi:tripartite-type tricarboxylate transporter receptor subunit TctC
MKRLLVAFFLSLSSLVYASETYTLVVPFPAGGTTDTTARYFADKLNKRFLDKFIIVNKPGANGIIAYQYFLENSKHNPNVLLFGTLSTILLEDMTNPNNTLRVSDNTRVLVNLGKSDLLLIARKNDTRNKPSDFKNSNIGYFSPLLHLNAKLLGFDKNGNEFIPYKGEAAARLALLSKEVDAIGDTSAQTDDFKSKVKVIGSSNSLNLYGVFSIVVMKNFDPFKLNDLNVKFNRVIHDNEVQEWMKIYNLHSAGGTPAEGDATYAIAKKYYTPLVK